MTKQNIDSIAVIDDDDVYKYTVKKTIEKESRIKKVFFFSDGKDAIDFFTENASDAVNLPDIIFLDLNMPIMDGWQFLDEYILMIPSFGKKIIVYIVSTSMNPHDLIRAKAISEVTDYIVKPITTERFAAILNVLE